MPQEPAVWQSLDGGTSWSAAGSGLPRGGVTALRLDMGASALHAGIAGAGLWRIPVPQP